MFGWNLKKGKFALRQEFPDRVMLTTSKLWFNYRLCVCVKWIIRCGFGWSVLHNPLFKLWKPVDVYQWTGIQAIKRLHPEDNWRAGPKPSSQPQSYDMTTTTRGKTLPVTHASCHHFLVKFLNCGNHGKHTIPSFLRSMPHNSILKI